MIQEWIRHLAADFDYSPKETDILHAEVSFKNTSDRSEHTMWNIEGHGVGNEEMPVWTFSDTGTHLVSLMVADQYGCVDSTAKQVYIAPFYSFHLPNAFTPNGDGKNDVFIGTGILPSYQSFRLRIWNRYGDVVYVTDNPAQGWDGRKPSGKLLHTGVYVWQLEITHSSGEVQKDAGEVLLLR